MSLPRDFEWHQSSVATLLTCPERFRLRYVERCRPDHQAGNYAAPLGTADHAGIEHVLHRVNAGEKVERGPLLDVVIDAFQSSVADNQDKGATYDPDGVGRALERLEGERLERLLSLADDERVHAIDWQGIEWGFDFAERGGRRWKGIIDAWGVAKRDVPDFGALGRDPVGLRQGEGLVVDWKTGELPPFGYVERSRSVQLGIYAMALSRKVRRPWRTFLGMVQDLERPKAPTDADGQRIPKRLPKRLNPAWARATGDPTGKSRKRPSDADGNPIPKWEPEAINPAWEAARARPRGPVFREARVRYGLVLDTTRKAIRLAEAGIYPASGAVTGQCGRCSFSTICLETTTRESA